MPPPLPPDSTSLRELQRLVARAIMRPLTPQDRMQPLWDDGRPASEVVASFIKPNDRLTSFDRLEIYNRQYWFRLLDCLHDDYPGLRAVLGDRRFMALAQAYLVKYPSASATLRDLGRRLIPFLAEAPGLTRPYQKLATDMARLEWAQVVAFDAAARRPASLQSLGRLAPDRIHLRLQPYITLLDLSYPVDQLVVRLLRQDAKLRSEASNALETPDRPPQRSLASRIKPQKTFLLVHRQQNSVYFKKLSEPEFRVLRALDQGASLAAALDVLPTLRSARSLAPADIQRWFHTWATLRFLVPVSRA